MPLELDRKRVATIIGDWPRERRLDIEGALGWMGMDEEPDSATFTMSRRGLLEYLWYSLPVKYLADVEDQLAVADALAALLEQFGARGQEYAAFCRAPETQAQIRRWDTDRDAAREELGRLLQASGTEAPDLPDLAWGSVMGLHEAMARDAVEARMEDALESGAFLPGQGSWAATQRALAAEVLAQPAGGLGDPRATWREAIDAERIERWVGSVDRPRHELCAPVVAELAAMAPLEPPRDADDPGDVIGWLMTSAADTGLPLTATGALNRATVRECVARRPAWYPREWPAPSRETDVVLVHQIAQLLDVSKLVRKRKGVWHATKRAKKLAGDPVALRLALLGAHLGDGFTGAVAELVLCVLLTADGPQDPDKLVAEVTPPILDGGWRADGQPLSRHHIIHPVYDTVRVLVALDLNAEWAERGQLHGHLTSTGRAFAAHALRANATAPRVR